MWIKINGFDKYEINEKGNIRNILINNKVYLKPWVGSKKPHNYLRVSLFKLGKQYKFLLHRLIALHFIPNPFNKPQVNHIDGNRQNNSLDNLEWVTNSENQKHSFAVTKTWKHNNPMNGKFGLDHNTSKPFWIKFSNGNIKKYGSEYEMVRDIGYGRTSISWARRNKFSGYKFNRGKMKGLIVYYENVLCGTI